MADSYKAAFRAARSGSAAKPSKYQLQQLKAKRTTVSKTGASEQPSSLPANFFDSGSAPEAQADAAPSPLPAGFFDAAPSKPAPATEEPPEKRQKTSEQASGSGRQDTGVPSALHAALGGSDDKWGKKPSVPRVKGGAKGKTKPITKASLAGAGPSSGASVEPLKGAAQVASAGDAAGDGLPLGYGSESDEDGGEKAAQGGEQGGGGKSDLPKGFFDDRNKDAAARGVTKKSEAELLAEFQTEVQAAEETGDVEATKEVEVEAKTKEAEVTVEQMARAVRVGALRDKLEDARATSQGDKARERAARLSRLQRLVTGAVEDEGEEDEESSDDSEEQGLDWRAKHVA